MLADYNRAAKALFLPEFLRVALTHPLVNLRAQPTALPAGPDSFMPASFWQSQNPYNDPKVGWAKCCATVKAMMESVNGQGHIPENRYDVVTEHVSSTKWVHGYRQHDYYLAASNAQQTALGFHKLDEYMALHKPVMVGVSHTLGLLFSSKNKKTGITSYRQINDGTIDHFVAIVGVGIDKKGKYYRFFNVGTRDRLRGTDSSNRLYFNPATGFYEGTGKAEVVG